MKLRNVLIVLGTATVTAVLTLALAAAWGEKAQAGAAVRPVIGQARLASQGCTFSLTTDKTDYEAGQTPRIEVKAVNPTDRPVNASVWVIVTSASPTSRMSRMMPMPTLVWKQEYAFRLGPDETKSLGETCAALPALGNVSINLADQNNAILAAIYGVPGQGQPQGNNQAAVAQVIAAAQAGPNGPPREAAPVAASTPPTGKP